MSTVTIVKKNGFAAIAADTLASYGSLKLPAEYSTQPGKILRIGHSYLGMTGWAVNQQVLEHAIRSSGESPVLLNSAEIFDVFLKLHPKLKDDYFLVPRGDARDAYESSQMNVMIANPHGIFGVGSLRTVTGHERFWASGSGMEYALGAMHALYDGAADAVAIAEAGVAAAITFDDGTGAPIESHLIPMETGTQLLEPVELLEPVGTAR